MFGKPAHQMKTAGILAGELRDLVFSADFAQALQSGEAARAVTRTPPQKLRASCRCVY